VAALDPELLADTLGEYIGAWWLRIRSGESGALPILAGLVLVVVIFQSQNHHFLGPLNLVNLIGQSSFFILLGAAEMFALLLSEIDLSVGFMAGVGAAIVAALVSGPYNWPWWAAVIVGMAICTGIGLLQGTLITRLHLPSFVVTLAGLLGLSGVLIWIFDIDKGSTGGELSITNKVIYNLVNGTMSTLASWIVLVVLVALFAFVSLAQTQRLRSSGLTAPPLSIVILKIVLAAVAGAVLVIVCNLNRGLLAPLRGVPWVVLYILAAVAVDSVVRRRGSTSV